MVENINQEETAAEEPEEEVEVVNQGETAREDLLDEIFSRFCLGK